MSKIPLGAFLSENIDSTTVVKSMAHTTSEAPVACSVGFEKRSHDELNIAQRSAAQLGAMHHTEMLRTDPTLTIDILP